MRAGLCTVPQALTVEAASIVKQAVSLARRRGHAQVTPLHVASAMLAAPTGLLRRACLQAHSHPLQCKALELCFNVALNRLPATTSSPLLGPHSARPSLSNALVAAFKRAQAHQRRGSIENQQQPILALKIEIEQLIISILDDPSVSRVMREAGFSSSQVKTRVEEDVSLDICSQSPPAVSSQSKESTKFPQILGASASQALSFGQFGLKPGKPLQDEVRNDDIMSLLYTLVNKRRNTVIVGGCLASAESMVRGITDKFEKGQVPGDLRYAQFISLPLFSLRHLSKEEVEQKLLELRCLVKGNMRRGVVLYLGDLKWVAEFWSTCGEQRRNYFCAVEYIIMELKRLVCENRESERLWLMGIATFQTYMRCKTGHPSLEAMWELHPLSTPVGSLSLSLNLESDSQSKVARDGFGWPRLLEGGADNHSTFYSGCSVNFNREAQKKVSTTTTVPGNSTLPLWLRQYKEESRRNNIAEQEFLDGPVPKHNEYPDKVHNFCSSSPSSISISSSERQTDRSWPIIFEPKKVPKEHQFWVSEISEEGYESRLRNQPKPDLLSNPNSSPNSASSSEQVVEEDTDGLNRFKELNDENLKILCDALEKRAPWHTDIIPEIASTILECRSGKSQRQGQLKPHRDDPKEETWLLFSGPDAQGKEKVARELAKVIFGSQSNFTAIGLSNFSSTRTTNLADDGRNKRARDEMGCSYLERLGLALNENPHRVFFMEDVEEVDYSSQKGFKQAIESGSITLPGGEVVPLKDSIIIFSCDSFSTLPSRACTSPRPKDDNIGSLEEKSSIVSLDLNIAIEADEHHEDKYRHLDGDIIKILESLDRQIMFKIQEL